MKNEKDLFSAIEGYVHNTLSNEEQIAFEKLLSENKELKETTELSLAAQKAIQRKKLYEVKNLIKEVHTEKTKGKRLKKTALFGGLLALCGLGICFFWRQDAVTSMTEHKSIPPSVPPIQVVPKAAEVRETLVAKKSSHKEPNEPKVVTPSIVSDAPLLVEPAEGQIPSIEPYVSPLLPEPANKPPLAVSPPSVKEIENSCAHVNLEASATAEPSCQHQSTGRIVISGIKGGTAPYSFQLLNQQNQVVMMDHLPAGTYSLILSDKQHCEKIIEGIKVKEENCVKDYELNLANGDVVDWGIATQATTLSVLDKGEIVYFYKRFNAGEPMLWDGVSSSGTHKNGYFIYVLQYQDGTALNGSVTVFK